MSDTQNTCNVCGYSFATSSYFLPIGTLIAGRYSIGKKLGQGGFGITYKGTDQKLKRMVAIKEFFMEGSTRTSSTVVPLQQSAPVTTTTTFKDSKMKPKSLLR